MANKVDVDWDKVRQEKAAGVSATELADKYGVHVSSIYLHAKANGNDRAGGGKKRLERGALPKVQSRPIRTAAAA